MKYFIQIKVAIISIVLTGLVIKTYWEWFIISIFQIRPISIPEALGISLMISLLTLHSHKENNNKDLWEIILISLLSNLYYILVGYIIHLFI